jgi:hypothetical protein
MRKLKNPRTITSMGMTAIAASAALSLFLMGSVGSPREANGIKYECNFIQITSPQNGQSFSNSGEPIHIKFTGRASSCQIYMTCNAVTWHIDGVNFGSGCTQYKVFADTCSPVKHTATLSAWFPDGKYREAVVSFTTGAVC